jgi:hypothetical protein
MLAKRLPDTKFVLIPLALQILLNHRERIHIEEIPWSIIGYNNRKKAEINTDRSKGKL